MAEVPFPRGGGLPELRGRSGWGPIVAEGEVRVRSSYSQEGGKGKLLL